MERYGDNVGVSGYVIPELREPGRVKSLGADLPPRCVVFAPFSSDAKREWSHHHWRTLVGLLHAAGYSTACLTPPKRPWKFGGTLDLHDVSAERMAGVLLNAACYVGGDSGPAHLAGALGVPAVVLGGVTRVAKIFDCYPSVTCLQSRRSTA